MTRDSKIKQNIAAVHERTPKKQSLRGRWRTMEIPNKPRTSVAKGKIEMTLTNECVPRIACVRAWRVRTSVYVRTHAYVVCEERVNTVNYSRSVRTASRWTTDVGHRVGGGYLFLENYLSYSFPVNRGFSEYGRRYYQKPYLYTFDILE